MTTVRLKKRGTIALIVYFLLITALCAPLAFLAGRAQGKVETAPLSHNEPDLRADYAALHRARRAGSDCGGASDPDASQRAVWEIICHPYRDGSGGGNGAAAAGGNTVHSAQRTAAANAADNNQRRGPLDDATLTAIAAGGNTAGEENAGAAGSPLSLALAPDAGGSIFGPGNNGLTLSSGGFGPSGGFGGFGGPNAPGGLPGNIIPNIPGGNTPTLPPTAPPPTVVTPVPGALPLLLTGIAGLFAASRRRRSG